MRRIAASVTVVVLAVSLSGRLEAQNHGHVLHVPVPGDLPVDSTLDATGSAPPVDSSGIRQAAGASNPWREQQPVNESNVARPRDSWDAPLRELDTQTRSGADTRLSYEEVFSPSVSPFKRSQAYDQIDELGRLTVRDPSMHPVDVDERVPLHWVGQRRSTFVGVMQVELSGAWPTPLPGVAAEQRLVSYSTSNDATVQFARDSAGALYVRGDAATVRLTWVLEAPDSAFEAPVLPHIPLSDVPGMVPDELRPQLPSWLAADARHVLTHAAGVDPGRDTFDEALSKLVQYFRSFRDAELQQGNDGQRLYLQLAMGRVGACRHRAYAMMPTLQALGIPARYVNNEAHAWVEAYVPGRPGYWTRLDLGGWNVPLDTHEAATTAHFQSGNADPFPRPREYDNGYSVAADTAANGAALTAGGGLPGAAANAGAAGVTAGGPGASSPAGAAAATSAAGAPATTRAGAGVDALAPVGRTAGGPRAEQSGTTSDPVGESRADSDEDVLGTAMTLGSAWADEGGRPGDGTGTFVRGTMLRVQGDVHDERGLGVGGLPVEVRLMRNRSEGRALGTTVTRPDGHWEARVLLPGDVGAGEYVLRAMTPGDAHHASASAE